MKRACCLYLSASAAIPWGIQGRVKRCSEENSTRWLWLLATLLLLTGCFAPGAYDGHSYGDREERPWMESYTIEKGGKCQLQCTRYGNTTKCREYRC